MTTDWLAMEGRALGLGAIERDGVALPDATRPKRITLLSLSELLQLQDPTFLVEGLLVEHTLAIVYADREAFKTFLILSWCIHIAIGREWFGHAVRQGRVVYIAAEGGQGIRKRANALVNAMGLDPDMVPFYTVPHAIDITDTEQVAELLELLEDEPVALVVVDTYARATPGRSSKDDQDWSAALLGSEILQRQTGATVLFVDHANKSGEGGATGTHQKEASADTVFTVKRERGSYVATLKTTKQKDFEHAPDIEFQMTRHGNSLVLVVPEEAAPQTVEDLTPSLRIALEYLGRLEEGEEGVAPTVWLGATKLAPSTFYLARAAAVRGNLVEVKDLGKNRKRYKLTPGGRELVRAGHSNATPTALQLERSSHSTPNPLSKGVGVGVDPTADAA